MVDALPEVFCSAAVSYRIPDKARCNRVVEQRSQLLLGLLLWPFTIAVVRERQQGVWTCGNGRVKSNLQKGGSPWEVLKTWPRCSTLPGMSVTTGCASAHPCTQLTA